MRPAALHRPTVGPVPTSPRLRAVLVAWMAVVAVALSAAPPGGAETSTPVDLAVAADGALDWIIGQLDANDGTMPGFGPGTTDWGLTVDAVLALAVGGRGEAAVTVRAADLLAGSVEVFTTWAPVMPEVRVAGATAKVLLTMRTLGRSGVIGGVDLEAELRDLLIADGDEAGRFTDRVPDAAWNTANAFGQSFAMLALAMTTGGVPPASVDYVIAQQCPSGGFPLDHIAGGCTDDSLADTDATALVLQALLGVERGVGVTESLTAATTWLMGRQDPVTGAFGGSGPTAGVNTNSSGLVAQTLRAAGNVAAADRTAGWIIRSNQLTALNAFGGPAESDIGAIAYDPAALAGALASGMTAQKPDQWRRSTVQAVLALGLRPYGPGGVEPLGGGSTTTTTSTVTSSTGVSSTSTSAAPETTAPATGGSTTTSGSTEIPAGGDTTPPGGGTGQMAAGGAGPGGAGLGGVGVDSADVLGSSTGADRLPGAGSGPTRLARTGPDVRLPVAVGLALVASGALAAAVGHLAGGSPRVRRPEVRG